MRIIGDVAVAAWLLWGLWCLREYRWAQWWFGWLSGGVAGGAVSWLCLFWGAAGAATALIGAWAMAILFMLGLWVVRVVLAPGQPVLGVARTLIDEAIRMKLAVVFIAAMVLLVALLPWMTGTGERLSYRIQSFLSWSLMGSTLMLSLMTIFLACGTICHEMSHRQIYMTLTKPISRAEYLVGKWLGIVLLNLLLLVVAGAGIIVFARLLQATQPAMDQLDALAVDQQVLVAREAIDPKPPKGMSLGQMRDKLIEQIRAENRGDTEFKLTPKAMQEVTNTAIYQWHTVQPGGDEGYLFTGLKPAKKLGGTVQLRLKPKASIPAMGNARVRLAMMVNGRLWPRPFQGVYRPIEIPDQITYVENLTASDIDYEGNMEIRIRNLDEPMNMVTGSITFEPGKGLQLLYRVGWFETNLLKALSVVWFRLAFLAMLGLTAGTFLGFPVATLLALLIYISASISGFLSESLNYFASLGGKDAGMWDLVAHTGQQLWDKASAGEIYGVIKIVTKVIGSLFMTLVPSLSDFNPTPMIVDGRRVPTVMVVNALWLVGGLWTVGCALVGWIIFRGRELARVTV